MPDEEITRFATDETRQVGVMLLGRKLYETMLYWETADQDPSLDDSGLEFIAIWKPLPKVVFSTTLSSVQGNARLASGGLAEEIERLRAEPRQGDIAIGGATLAAEAAALGRLGDRIGHRQVLLALYVLRAAAFIGLALVHDLGVTLVVLSVIALGDQAASSMYQALANVMASKQERVGLMAWMRVVTNIGITLGTVPAGIALATRGSFAPLLLANAASYLLAGLIVATLPASTSPAGPAAHRRLLIPSPATATMISINGLMSLWVVILNVGLPLWVVDSTAAPRALVAILYGTNTVVAIFVQAWVARWVSSYLRAARAQRLAGVMLALCCGCLAGSAFASSTAATILLVAAVLCLSSGELLTVSSAWEVSFRLAPDGRSAEFFATYGLGRAGSQVLGPILITAAVLALGVPGWVALAGLFIVGGLITPLTAQRALDHPLKKRKQAPDTSARVSAKAATTFEMRSFA